jgi:hypothetical protein
MPWEGKGQQTKAACKVARAMHGRSALCNPKLSRPFRPHGIGVCLPRASAFGLSPGLGSPGPLGRFCQVLASTRRMQIVSGRAYNALAPRHSGAGSHSPAKRYGITSRDVECMSSPYNAPGLASYTRSDQPIPSLSSDSFLILFSGWIRGLFGGEPLLRGPAGELTLMRRRRRIKESYRINDIRQRRDQPPGRNFDHERHSGGKWRQG